jgi:hypothetical protein
VLAASYPSTLIAVDDAETRPLQPEENVALPQTGKPKTHMPVIPVDAEGDDDDDTPPTKPTKTVPDIKYYVTRHATSCNNENKGKNLFGKDKEPSLTLAGIQGAFDHEFKAQAPEAAWIHGSCLIRTWETLFVEYGAKTAKTELNILVSPFLKEKGKFYGVLQRGNIYKPPNEQLQKFVKFVKYIDQNYATLSKKSKYVASKTKLTIKKVNFKFTGGDTLYTATVVKNNKGEWKYCGDVPANFYDTNARFAKDGDILEWVTHLRTLGNGEHYAVAHSGIMKRFVKALNEDTDADFLKWGGEGIIPWGKPGAGRKMNGYRKTYKKQNCWTLYGSVDDNTAVDLAPGDTNLKFYEGFLPETQDGNLEDSLCGSAGSSDYVDLPKCPVHKGKLFY